MAKSLINGFEKSILQSLIPLPSKAEMDLLHPDKTHHALPIMTRAAHWALYETSAEYKAYLEAPFNEFAVSGNKNFDHAFAMQALKTHVADLGNEYEVVTQADEQTLWKIVRDALKNKGQDQRSRAVLLREKLTELKASEVGGENPEAPAQL